MKTEKQNRREFLQLGAAGIAALSVMKNVNANDVFKSDANEELVETTVHELQAKMKAGEISAKQLVEKYLERIRDIDPKLKSVIETNPDALKIAEDLDRERKKGKSRGNFQRVGIRFDN